METVKKTDEYTVFKKRSGRYGVKNSSGKWINSNEKVQILVNEGLLKVAVPTEEAPVVEAPAEEAPAAEETTVQTEEEKEKIVEERIKPQIEGLGETVTSIETNYATEMESITQNQEEYKEFVQANKDKKQSLLDNMLTMMNLPAGSVPEITPENLNQFIAEANQRNTNGGN